MKQEAKRNSLMLDKLLDAVTQLINNESRFLKYFKVVNGESNEIYYEYIRLSFLFTEPLVTSIINEDYESAAKIRDVLNALDMKINEVIHKYRVDISDDEKMTKLFKMYNTRYFEIITESIKNANDKERSR